MKTTVIAIDGPTASGKGAVAQAVAQQLGFIYLDSGALYRLIALQALRNGIVQEQPLTEAHRHQLSDWATDLDVLFEGDQIVCAGENVTDLIRDEKVGNMASKIAVVGELRDALLHRQRDFAQTPGLVADGRDMGSVVFPQAQTKIFLTASSQVRAERRYKQLIGKGFSANMHDLVADLNERDERDSKRTHAPLKPAQDAFVLDSTDLTLESTVEKVLQYHRSTSV